MLRLGTTTCEAKSGYGLDVDTELKQLRVNRRLGEIQPVELVSTYLGAHALPTEYRDDREGYLRLMCQQMIPRVAQEKLASFCDVFCETGVFTAQESVRILQAGQVCGLPAKIHTDEIDPIGGTEAAGAPARRLRRASDRRHGSRHPGPGRGRHRGRAAAATSFYLNKPYARARDMIAAGVPVAAATDYNPGSCPSLNLQLVMNLACWNYRMRPEEVLTAVTLNAAAAISRADRIGSLEVGKQARPGDLERAEFGLYFLPFWRKPGQNCDQKGRIV